MPSMQHSTSALIGLQCLYVSWQKLHTATITEKAMNSLHHHHCCYIGDHLGEQTIDTLEDTVEEGEDLEYMFRSIGPIHPASCTQHLVLSYYMSNTCMQDLLVMYRQTQPSASKLVKLRQRIIGPNEQESTPKYQQRNSINMRIYRDIPVPSWKIVFPNKLLQFRPLDGLRSDLVSIAGLLCECSITCFMQTQFASLVKCSALCQSVAGA